MALEKEGGDAGAGGALARAAERKRRNTLQPRVASAAYEGLEYSAHVAPGPMARDLAHVFPGALPTGTEVIVVPTLQRAALPLLEFGKPQEAEKDRCLRRFFEWAGRLRDAIRRVAPGAWVDVTDPASGRAHYGAQGAGYSDVDGLSKVDTYPTELAGGCRVMRHPQWGAAVYPATLFTDAGWGVVRQALDEVNAPGKRVVNAVSEGAVEAKAIPSSS